MNGIVHTPIATGSHRTAAADLNSPAVLILVRLQVDSSTVRFIINPGTMTEARNYQTIASNEITKMSFFNTYPAFLYVL